MTSYVQKTLGEGERVLHTASLTLWRFWRGFLYGIALWSGAITMVVQGHYTQRWWELGGVAGFCASLFFLWPFILRHSTELVVTDRRVVVKTGVLSTRALEIRFNKIESIRVTQSLLGRFLGFGSVDIVGTGSTFDPLDYIADPLAFKNQVSAAMEHNAV
jgi:uncharacterized membrane protein YdbT with pleckstrin-like domain